MKFLYVILATGVNCDIHPLITFIFPWNHARTGLIPFILVTVRYETLCKRYNPKNKSVPVINTNNVTSISLQAKAAFLLENSEKSYS